MAWQLLTGAVITGTLALAQTDSVPARPADPVSAIVDAFRTHDVVAVGDAHGNVQSQNFLKTLIRDPRFTAVANDIVVEFGNARYQDVVDRYVRGEAVDERSVRSVWQNTTVANEIPVDPEFFETVRAVNATLPPDKRLRVLLSDPPIDWAAVKTRQDHFTWLAMRDTYPAALVQVEVLAKGRRALLVYGQLHYQRHNIMSNLEMNDWRMQTIVSLIEHGIGPGRVFTIWQFDDGLARAQADVASWPAPSIAVVRGTRIGAADVTVLMPSRARMSFATGKPVPVAENDFRPLRVEDQMDAVLYLGPRGTMTESQPSDKSCAEPGYLDERLRRIALTGIPAFEAERVRALCAGKK
jgi:hypothetical protein